MSTRLTSNKPYPGSWVKVTPPGMEGAPDDRVRIETLGPVDLNGTEVRMLVARLLRWSKPRPAAKAKR